MARLSPGNTDVSVTPIVLNDFKSQWEEIKDSALSALDRVGKSGWLILGEEVAAFEHELARVWGLPYCIGCANGLDAIEISLRCLGARPGDKVLTTPLSAFATTLAIIRAGCMPLFVDVDESGLLDLDQCVQVLEEEQGIRFLLPVHLYGHSLNLERLAEIRDRFGIAVVEDCAQAVGAKSNGVVVGSIGGAAATSFYPTKNLGCMGDGGAVLTNDLEIASIARSLRDYGQSEKYRHTRLGLNSRLDELHAAILKDALLPLLDTFTERRKEISSSYIEGIKNPLISIPSVPEGSESVWHLFPLVVEGDRNAFQLHLKKSAIASGIHYPVLIPDQHAMNSFDQPLVRRELKTAKRFADQEISIPIHPYLTDHDIERVIASCNSWRN